MDGDAITITELPVGKWTEQFLGYVRDKLHCGSARDATASRFVVEIVNTSTDVRVHLQLRCVGDKLRQASTETLEKLLHMRRALSVSNMHMHDADGKLRLFATPDDVVAEHGRARLALYARRRERQIAECEADVLVATNRVRFIGELAAGSLDLRALTRAQAADELASRDYAVAPSGAHAGSYEYLLGMECSSLTLDRMEALREAAARASARLEAIRRETPSSMWHADLDTLEGALDKYVQHKESLRTAAPRVAAAAPRKGGRGPARARKGN